MEAETGGDQVNGPPRHSGLAWAEGEGRVNHEDTHVLILAGAILGAGWMLKPVPVEQVSQAELEPRKDLFRWALEQVEEVKRARCAACPSG